MTTEVFLILDILPTGEPLYDKPFTDANQPRPIHLDVLCLDAEMNEMASLSAYVRPEDWRVPDSSPMKHRTVQQNAVASTCLLPLISGPGGAMSTSRYVMAYDFDRLDFIMKCWRVALGKDPAWVPMKRQTISLRKGAEAWAKQDNKHKSSIPDRVAQLQHPDESTVHCWSLLKLYLRLTESKIIPRAG